MFGYILSNQTILSAATTGATIDATGAGSSAWFQILAAGGDEQEMQEAPGEVASPASEAAAPTTGSTEGASTTEAAAGAPL